jgi:hypothetical protein
MRYVAIAVLVALPIEGQVIREGLTKMRQEGMEIMLAVYRRPDVADYCEKNPDKEFTVRVNGEGSEITVHCPTRREFLALIERPPQPQ